LNEASWLWSHINWTFASADFFSPRIYSLKNSANTYLHLITKFWYKPCDEIRFGIFSWFENQVQEQMLMIRKKCDDARKKVITHANSISWVNDTIKFQALDLDISISIEFFRQLLIGGKAGGVQWSDGRLWRAKWWPCDIEFTEVIHRVE